MLQLLHRVLSPRTHCFRGRFPWGARHSHLRDVAPPIFRTQDSNAAWAAAEGLLPIRDGFSAPGFVPTRLVGGVTYKVRSPQAPSPRIPRPTTRQASAGRQLFAEYAGAGMQSSDLQQNIAAQGLERQQQPSSHSFHLQQQQQAVSQAVRLYPFSFICAYIDINAAKRTSTLLSTYATWHAGQCTFIYAAGQAGEHA
jgi:hypothetical protein